MNVISALQAGSAVLGAAGSLFSGTTSKAAEIGTAMTVEGIKLGGSAVRQVGLDTYSNAKGALANPLGLPIGMAVGGITNYVVQEATNSLKNTYEEDFVKWIASQSLLPGALGQAVGPISGAVQKILGYTVGANVSFAVTPLAQTALIATGNYLYGKYKQGSRMDAAPILENPHAGDIQGPALNNRVATQSRQFQKKLQEIAGHGKVVQGTTSDILKSLSERGVQRRLGLEATEAMAHVAVEADRVLSQIQRDLNAVLNDQDPALGDVGSELSNGLSMIDEAVQNFQGDQIARQIQQGNGLSVMIQPELSKQENFMQRAFNFAKQLPGTVFSYAPDPYAVAGKTIEQVKKSGKFIYDNLIRFKDAGVNVTGYLSQKGKQIVDFAKKSLQYSKNVIYNPLLNRINSAMSKDFQGDDINNGGGRHNSAMKDSNAHLSGKLHQRHQSRRAGDSRRAVLNNRMPLLKEMGGLKDRSHIHNHVLDEINSQDVIKHRPDISYKSNQAANGIAQRTFQLAKKAIEQVKSNLSAIASSQHKEQVIDKQLRSIYRDVPSLERKQQQPSQDNGNWEQRMAVRLAAYENARALDKVQKMVKDIKDTTSFIKEEGKRAGQTPLKQINKSVASNFRGQLKSILKTDEKELVESLGKANNSIRSYFSKGQQMISHVREVMHDVRQMLPGGGGGKKQNKKLGALNQGYLKQRLAEIDNQVRTLQGRAVKWEDRTMQRARAMQILNYTRAMNAKKRGEGTAWGQIQQHVQQFSQIASRNISAFVSGSVNAMSRIYAPSDDEEGDPEDDFGELDGDDPLEPSFQSALGALVDASDFSQFGFQDHDPLEQQLNESLQLPLLNHQVSMRSHLNQAAPMFDVFEYETGKDLVYGLLDKQLDEAVATLQDHGYDAEEIVKLGGSKLLHASPLLLEYYNEAKADDPLLRDIFQKSMQVSQLIAVINKVNANIRDPTVLMYPEAEVAEKVLPMMEMLVSKKNRIPKITPDQMRKWMLTREYQLHMKAIASNQGEVYGSRQWFYQFKKTMPKFLQHQYQLVAHRAKRNHPGYPLIENQLFAQKMDQAFEEMIGTKPAEAPLAPFYQGRMSAREQIENKVNNVDTLANGLNMGKMMEVAKKEITHNYSKMSGGRTFQEMLEGKNQSTIDRRKQEEAKGKEQVGVDSLMERLDAQEKEEEQIDEGLTSHIADVASNIVDPYAGRGNHIGAFGPEGTRVVDMEPIQADPAGIDEDDEY